MEAEVKSMRCRASARPGPPGGQPPTGGSVSVPGLRAGAGAQVDRCVGTAALASPVSMRASVLQAEQSGLAPVTVSGLVTALGPALQGGFAAGARPWRALTCTSRVRSDSASALEVTWIRASFLSRSCINSWNTDKALSKFLMIEASEG